MEFDWDAFKREEFMVHCKTEEEANDFCRQMHYHGMKWISGDSYLVKTMFNVYREATCYSGNGCYYNFYTHLGNKIVEWSDYMSYFDWNEFMNKENKIVVHCKTEEEFNDFRVKMHNHGIEWMNNPNIVKWITNKRDCYSNDELIGSLAFFERYYIDGSKYRIVEWSDYMNSFLKSDLKDGMIVVLRNGSIYIKIGDCLIGDNEWNLLKCYKNDLSNISNKDFDIIAVGKIKYGKPLHYLNMEDLEIIWRRKEKKFISSREAMDKLKELTGEEYETA